ncbi:hypothetical protein CHARACLAT_009568 [Characodon lateralis]|uniref:Uncharacterized protein n=1 Tax=Characodon lateralis TaxID=208331 RepID=A0ABU7ES87_9TELE|nr:hypothetical protein [Characodon lateralis]
MPITLFSVWKLFLTEEVTYFSSSVRCRRQGKTRFKLSPGRLKAVQQSCSPFSFAVLIVCVMEHTGIGNTQRLLLTLTKANSANYNRSSKKLKTVLSVTSVIMLPSHLLVGI